MSDSITLKICLAGTFGVGKTSLRRRFMGVSRFKRNYMPTVGSDFSYKELTVSDKNIQMMIWDLAGEQRFRSVRSLYFQGAHGALLVFDLKKKESFELLNEWILDIENYTETNGIPLFIIANKKDLILTNEEQAVSDEEIEAFVNEIRERYENRFTVDWIKASALTGDNVDKAFESLISTAISWKTEQIAVE